MAGTHAAGRGGGGVSVIELSQYRAKLELDSIKITQTSNLIRAFFQMFETRLKK